MWRILLKRGIPDRLPPLPKKQLRDDADTLHPGPLVKEPLVVTNSKQRSARRAVNEMCEPAPDEDNLSAPIISANLTPLNKQKREDHEALDLEGAVFAALMLSLARVCLSK